MGAALALLQLTHGSITTDDFDAAVRSWIATARHPRFGRSYAAMVYQPMVELVALLERDGFACWIFSGGGADFMRAWAPSVFGLPPHRIIGSTGSVTFRIGNSGPELFKGTDLAVIDDKEQKPISIHQSVGQRPILAAGNTDGDLAMLQWTAGSPHRTLEVVVHHTDAEREFRVRRRSRPRIRKREPVEGRGQRRLDGRRHRRRLGVGLRAVIEPRAGDYPPKASGLGGAWGGVSPTGATFFVAVNGR